MTETSLPLRVILFRRPIRVYRGNISLSERTKCEEAKFHVESAFRDSSLPVPVQSTEENEAEVEATWVSREWRPKIDPHIEQ